MAHVVLMRWLAARYTDGKTELEVPGLSVRHLVRELDRRYPGLGSHLEDGVAVAIDGLIHQNAFLERVEPDSEVCFMPALEGG